MAEIQAERKNRIETPPEQGRNGAGKDHARPDEKSAEKDDPEKEQEKKPTKHFKWTPLKIVLL